MAAACDLKEDLRRRWSQPDKAAAARFLDGRIQLLKRHAYGYRDGDLFKLRTYAPTSPASHSSDDARDASGGRAKISLTFPADPATVN